MKSSRTLQDLHPIVAAKVSRLIVACKHQGIEMMITCTYRDEEMQAERYALGRTVIGPNARARPMGHVVTDNPPGFSYHHYGLACDMWPLVQNRVITDWNEPEWAQVWRVIRYLAHDRAINLRDGGNYPLASGRRSWGHFHYSAGLSIEAIRAGERLPDVEI
jgi:peptidoglycan L-alanyl-D-glutamate endopeptidase CwlK